MAAEKSVESPTRASHFPTRNIIRLVFLAALLVYVSHSGWSLVWKTAKDEAKSTNLCRPPLPTLLDNRPIDFDDDRIVRASTQLDAFLTARVAEADVDSISVSIVTPFGPIFENGYGVLKANETSGSQGALNRHTIYRIASITKMFTVLETLVLRERGFLSWDDPVEKFIPDFKYPSYDWMTVLEGKSVDTPQKAAPITIRQLASHMAGIGRDFPGFNVPSWPHNSDTPGLRSHIPTASNATELVDEPSKRILASVATRPLIVAPYSFPIYSNTGMDLLGMTNLGAELLTGNTSVKTHNDLVKRDIFDALAFSGSFYGRPEGIHIANLAVPSLDSEWADKVFDTASDPSGGQYSSLADLAHLMKTFLAPQAAKGVVSDYVMREWLRPLHGWSDGFLEVGAPWEILKIEPGVRMYSKGGNLPGYHSQFSVNPQFSYGIIVLVTGEYADTVTLETQAINFFQPALEQILLERVVASYVGTWTNEASVADIVIMGGVLYLRKLQVEGVDILSLVSTGKPVALWSTGRTGEFRIAFGRPELNDTPFAGCEPYWITFDGLTGREHGIPTDLLYFFGAELVYPSADARMKRV